MDDLITLGAPGPPARQESDVPIEAPPADRAGSRLDLQGLGFNALLNAAPSHSGAEYSHARPNPQGVGGTACRAPT